MDTSGFYKLANGGLLFAPAFVHGPGYSLSRHNADDKLADVNGWQWFDSDALAYTFHGITPTASPDTLSPLQARLELLDAGLLDTVEAMVAASDRATQLAWHHATEFRRDSPLLIGMAQVIDLPPVALDGMFNNGRKRSV